MAQIVIDGGRSLRGDIFIQGSKNAALPMLAASLLNRGITRLYGCPKISDVSGMLAILESIGCLVEYGDHYVQIDSSQANGHQVCVSSAGQMRSSVFMMGALLGRFGEVSIPYPGGCTIGQRPIDIHLEALRQMNISLVESEEGIYGYSRQILGTTIDLRYPSVGATENIILAAVTARGCTVINHAAKEPEIIDLCLLLNKMGADIHGMGTGCITIFGVKILHDVAFTICADRIVAATYLAAAAVTCGNVQVFNVWEYEIKSVLQVLAHMGSGIVVQNKRIRVIGPQMIFPVDNIHTRPFPGFPTDMQSQMMACLSMAHGTSVIYEHIFEDRFKIVEELRKMGAKIVIEHEKAVIYGVESLYGANVHACDLRGSAALVIAGLMAEGCTTIDNSFYIKRGYQDICGDLKCLGAQIEERNMLVAK